MAEKKKKVGRQPQAVAEKTKMDIINSAAKVFAERGFDGANLRIISEKAKTTHGMIRHYFGTKEELWKTVVDHLINQFAIHQIPILEHMEDIDPVQLLKSYVRNYVQMSAKYPELGAIICNEGRKKGKRLNYILKYAIPFHRAIDPVFQAVQKKGLLTKYNTHDKFFLFLTTTAMIPMSLSSLTDKLLGGKIL